MCIAQVQHVVPVFKLGDSRVDSKLSLLTSRQTELVNAIPGGLL
jgi:hypothetical protein